MSLFENSGYRWRETYFVLFDRFHRPTSADLQAALGELGNRYKIGEIQENDEGQFESLTLFSPMDCAAMDISLAEGDEVREQIDELLSEWKQPTASPDEKAIAKRIDQCELRFDILHFEEIVADTGEDEEEILDPGALLTVLETLAEAVDGVAIDPQSGALM